MTIAFDCYQEKIISKIEESITLGVRELHSKILMKGESVKDKDQRTLVDALEVALNEINMNGTAESAREFINKFYALKEQFKTCSPSVEFDQIITEKLSEIESQIVYPLSLLLHDTDHKQQLKADTLKNHFESFFQSRNQTVGVTSTQTGIVFSGTPEELKAFSEALKFLEIPHDSQTSSAKAVTTINHQDAMRLAQFEYLVDDTKRQERINKKTITLTQVLKELVSTEKSFSEQAGKVGTVLAANKKQFEQKLGQEECIASGKKTKRELLDGVTQCYQKIGEQTHPWFKEGEVEKVAGQGLSKILELCHGLYKSVVSNSKPITKRVAKLEWLSRYYAELYEIVHSDRRLDFSKKSIAEGSDNDEAILNQYLITPIQRLPRIILLFKEIINYLNDVLIQDFDEEGLKTLEELRRLNNIFMLMADNVNRGIRAHENNLIEGYQLYCVADIKDVDLKQIAEKALILVGKDDKMAHLVENQKIVFSHEMDLSPAEKHFLARKSNEILKPSVEGKDLNTFRDLIVRVKLLQSGQYDPMDQFFRNVYRVFGQVKILSKSSSLQASQNSASFQALTSTQNLSDSYVQAEQNIEALLKQLGSIDNADAIAEAIEDNQEKFEVVADAAMYKNLEIEYQALTQSILSQSRLVSPASTTPSSTASSSTSVGSTGSTSSASKPSSSASVTVSETTTTTTSVTTPSTSPGAPSPDEIQKKEKVAGLKATFLGTLKELVDTEKNLSEQAGKVATVFTNHQVEFDNLGDQTILSEKMTKKQLLNDAIGFYRDLANKPHPWFEENALRTAGNDFNEILKLCRDLHKDIVSQKTPKFSMMKERVAFLVWISSHYKELTAVVFGPHLNFSNKRKGNESSEKEILEQYLFAPAQRLTRIKDLFSALVKCLSEITAIEGLTEEGKETLDALKGLQQWFSKFAEEANNNIDAHENCLIEGYQLYSVVSATEKDCKKIAQCVNDKAWILVGEGDYRIAYLVENKKLIGPGYTMKLGLLEKELVDENRGGEIKKPSEKAKFNTFKEIIIEASALSTFNFRIN